MMLFCKRSVNSFLGMAGMPAEEEKFQSCKCGLGLITSESHRLPNVIESFGIKPGNSDPAVGELKKDPGRVGFIDDEDGRVDGLMSCTESLGFESCEERRFDDGIGMGVCEGRKASTSGGGRWRSRGEKWRERKKKLPPPLTSLNQNGRPSFYLCPVRKDGKLELTEVRIERRETLRAHREGGRLTLHLLCSDYNEEEQDLQSDSNEEERELESNFNEEEREFESNFNEEQEFQSGKELEFQLEEEAEEEVKEEEEEEEEEEEKGIEKNWGYPMSGEGPMRCHELVMSHHRRIQHHHHHQIHHHNLHVWRQHCVPTR